jgi:hypothetical protein
MERFYCHQCGSEWMAMRRKRCSNCTSANVWRIPKVDRVAQIIKNLDELPRQ